LSKILNKPIVAALNEKNERKLFFLLQEWQKNISSIAYASEIAETCECYGLKKGKDFWKPN
jgi:hypothetical protein